jgi:hypothetical protein
MVEAIFLNFGFNEIITTSLEALRTEKNNPSF